jgi:hypothetical protein
MEIHNRALLVAYVTYVHLTEETEKLHSQESSLLFFPPICFSHQSSLKIYYSYMTSHTIRSGFTDFLSLELKNVTQNLINAM